MGGYKRSRGGRNDGWWLDEERCCDKLPSISLAVLACRLSLVDSSETPGCQAFPKCIMYHHRSFRLFFGHDHSSSIRNELASLIIWPSPRLLLSPPSERVNWSLSGMLQAAMTSIQRLNAERTLFLFRDLYRQATGKHKEMREVGCAVQEISIPFACHWRYLFPLLAFLV